MPSTKGERIREARIAAGLSLSELAELLNVDRQSVHRWEVGTRAPTGLYRATVERWLRKQGKR